MCHIVWDLNDKDMQDETDKKDAKQGQRLRNTHCIPCLCNISNTSEFLREKYSRSHTKSKKYESYRELCSLSTETVYILHILTEEVGIPF